MRKLLALVILCVAIFCASRAHCLENTRNFAIEINYGGANTTVLPLNEIGRKIYGNTIFTTPLGVDLTWAAGPRLNIGISCSNAVWKTDKSYTGTGGVYSDAQVTMTRVCPFIDLTPFFSEGGEAQVRGITNGAFLEVGPSFNTLIEEYDLDGAGTAFFASGTTLDIRLGFRTINRQAISFAGRFTVSIPISSDHNRSDTDLTADGAVTLSASAGICASF